TTAAAPLPLHPCARPARPGTGATSACPRQPFGYDSIKISGQPRKIVVNEMGRILKKAFIWKATEHITHDEICLRLKKLGLHTNTKRLAEYLRNPFYCGLITHNCLDGQIIEGKHEKLISKEMFLKVNDLLKTHMHGYNSQADGHNTPLRRFMKCDICGSPMRGYLVRPKQLYYYKCNTKTCRNNKSAQKIDEIFERILNKFSISLNDETLALLTNQMIADYNRLNEEKSNDRADLKRQVSEIENKLERLEERYVNEEINQELFKKYSEKYKMERIHIERELMKPGNEVSNLEKCVKMVIEFSSKLATVWRLLAYKEKMLLQKTLFPEGISYNKEKDQCRTTKVNSVILYFARLTGKWAEIKNGETKFLFDFPDYVPLTGMKSNRSS
ncbi:MAG TPA: recombinase family protein, partial [Bacteroidia bacterium]|nr:recombinase family protein [Bacteroidia bacterium]